MFWSKKMNDKTADMGRLPSIPPVLSLKHSTNNFHTQELFDMRSYFVITLLIALATIIDGNILPDAFYGKFSLGNSENFDEYLAAKGLLS